MDHGKNAVALGLSLAMLAADDLAAAQATSENLSASNGDAASLGTGHASAAPGSVTPGPGGTALLAPDGAYRVTEVTPPVVSGSGTSSPPEVVYTPAPVTETG